MHWKNKKIPNLWRQGKINELYLYYEFQYLYLLKIELL